ncbi:Glutamate receptor ionotropic like protein [Argiope bruennichi]|uniref:Glutamate receptor ionotropic like protein n=1 Tax=Argiope bruennichi TaxID=94029 RepID=A0A8T0G1Y8_ARGBR|nr:Glutamate receptor ionotropic like protein [Argiope bruennichi]
MPALLKVLTYLAFTTFHVKITNVTSPIFGLCHTLSVKKNDTDEAMTIKKGGTTQGIRLTLNIERSEYWNLISAEYGVRLLVHPQGTFPTLQRGGIIASPGRSVHIGVKRKLTKRLPGYEGSCTETFMESPIRTKLKSLHLDFDLENLKYTYEHCNTLCQNTLLFSKCQCLDEQPTSATIAKWKFCNPCNKTAGIEGKYLDVVLKALNKRFEIVFARDREWGSSLSDGNWTGMIGMIQRGEANLAFNSLSITDSRFDVVDFSRVYLIEDMTFQIKKPGTLPPSLALFRPFDFTIWMAVTITLLLMPLVIKYLLNTKDTYIKIFLKCFGSLLNQSSITKHYVSRNIVGSWLVFGMILTLSYSAILLSVLTVPLQIPAVKNFEELSEAVMKRGYRICLPKGSSILEFLIHSDKKHLKFLGQTALRNNWYSGSSQCAIDTNCAVMSYRSLFQIVAGPENWKVYYMSEESLLSLNFAFGMEKGFRYKKQLNTIISRASSAGIYNKFVSDESYKYLLFKASTMYINKETKAFSIRDLLGCFLILSLGLSLSTLTFIGEVVYHRFKKRKKAVFELNFY